MGDMPNESTILESVKPVQAITVTNQYEDQDRMEQFKRRKTSILKRLTVVLLSVFVSVESVSSSSIGGYSNFMFKLDMKIFIYGKMDTYFFTNKSLYRNMKACRWYKPGLKDRLLNAKI